MNETTEMKKGKDGSAMAHVLAGPFLMGSETGNADERPQREVTLDAFWIDKCCVTNAQYRAFLEETNAFPPPPSFSKDDFVGPEQPIVSISWEEANAYAQWVGKRLPTEAEWEKASRGTDGRKYPWGEDEPSYERAVYASMDIHRPGNVDELEESASPYGCVQMAGNVFEWVSDWFDGFYYQTGPAENPQGLEKPTFEVAMARVPVFAVPGGGTLSMGEVKRGERYEILLRDEDSYKILFGNTEGWLPRRAGYAWTAKVARGCGWDYIEDSLRCSAREGFEPWYKNFNIGFRCAMDA